MTYVEADAVPINPGFVARLRAWRYAESIAQGVPPYVVLTNSTMYDLVEKCPTTLDDLRGVRGMTEVRIARYGQAILDAITPCELSVRDLRVMFTAMLNPAGGEGCAVLEALMDVAGDEGWRLYEALPGRLSERIAQDEEM